MNIEELKKEMPCKWRIGQVKNGKAKMLAYVDARDVMDRLDAVVGAENWQSDYKEANGQLFAGVAIKVDGDWVWKWDTGAESTFEKEKGEVSDSFKRAAVKWGVGRFLYSYPSLKVNVDGYNRVVDKDMNPVNPTEYCNKLLAYKLNN